MGKKRWVIEIDIAGEVKKERHDCHCVELYGVKCPDCYCEGPGGIGPELRHNDEYSADDTARLRRIITQMDASVHALRAVRKGLSTRRGRGR